MIPKKTRPGVRLAIAHSKFDKARIQDRRPECWFRCGKIAVRRVTRKYRGKEYETDETGFPTNQTWQEDLARTMGYEGAISEYLPSEVPITLLGANPVEWMDLHLACWSMDCTGRHMLSGAYSPKSDAFLEQPEQAAALSAQGLDGYDDDDCRFHLGKAKRRGEGIIDCDPLTCPYYGNPDREKQCKPVVDFSFQVEWATNETSGSFKSRAWGSLAWLVSDLSKLQKQLAAYQSTIAAVPCMLKVEPRNSVNPETGKPIVVPAVGLSLRGTLDELAALSEQRRKALQQVTQKALPASLRELRSSRDTRIAVDEEFTPEAHAAQMTAEDAFRDKYSDDLSEAVIDNLLHQFDADLDGAEVAAEAMIRKPAPDEEEPIDAEFSEDEEPRENSGTVEAMEVLEDAQIDEELRKYREAASDVPKDVQKQWFTEAGSTWGERPTLAQAKALVEKAGGA